MRAIRTTTISILALGLLAGSAVGVAAQDEEGTEASTPVVVTGTVGEPAEFVPGTYSDDGASMQGDQLVDIPVDASDPRLSGALDIVMNGTSDGSPDDLLAQLESHAWRLENDGGAWVGTGTAVQAIGSDGPLWFQEAVLLEGEGGYDGLVAFVSVDYLAEVPLEAVIVGADAPEPASAE